MSPEISRENSIPKKSARYHLGEAIIRRQFNDVEFYFEDENQQEMYYSIMQKLFGEKIKFDKVFITCGKVNAYKQLKKHRNDSRKVYILDKDFDDLLRKKKRGINNLFYLDRYSIENFLAEEEALKWLIISRRPTLNRNSVALPYNSLITQVTQDLRLLTSYFFLAGKYKLHKHVPGFKTCKLPINLFLQGTDNISSTKINIYWQEIESAILAHYPGKIPAKLLDSAKKSIDYNSLSMDGVYKHIPGKYFLELLRRKMNTIHPFMTSLEVGQMKFLLADKCEFTSLNSLKGKIGNYLDLT